MARDVEFYGVIRDNITLVIGQYADALESRNDELDAKIVELEKQMLQMVRENPDFNDGAFLERYRALGGEIQRLKQEKVMKAPSPPLPCLTGSSKRSKAWNTARWRPTQCWSGSS